MKLRQPHSLEHMPLSGADHINAQLYPHQLWELGQKVYPLSLVSHL